MRFKADRLDARAGLKSVFAKKLFDFAIFSNFRPYLAVK